MFMIIRAVLSVVATLTLLAFAGITLAVTAVVLVISTPLFVIFSPVLVPATIAATLLTSGFTASAGLLLTAAFHIITTIFKKYTRKAGKDAINIPGTKPPPASNPAGSG